MTHLLHLDVSARSRSLSRELGSAFARAWRAHHPDGTYTYRDLARQAPPPIDEAWTEICDELMRRRITEIDRYAEAVTTPAQARAWAIVQPLLSELVAADVVLVATPMYNYSVPAALKLWIDQVTFPRMSLAGRHFVVASARGGSYAPNAPKAAWTTLLPQGPAWCRARPRIPRHDASTASPLPHAPPGRASPARRAAR